MKRRELLAVRLSLCDIPAFAPVAVHSPRLTHRSAAIPRRIALPL
jgi:hypothetical protein